MEERSWSERLVARNRFAGAAALELAAVYGEMLELVTVPAEHQQGPWAHQYTVEDGVIFDGMQRHPAILLV